MPSLSWGGSDASRASTNVPTSSERLSRAPASSNLTLWHKSRMRSWSLSGGLRRETLALMTLQVSSEIRELCTHLHESFLGTTLRIKTKIVAYQDDLLGMWSRILMCFPRYQFDNNMKSNKKEEIFVILIYFTSYLIERLSLWTTHYPSN